MINDNDEIDMYTEYMHENFITHIDFTSPIDLRNMIKQLMANRSNEQETTEPATSYCV